MVPGRRPLVQLALDFPTVQHAVACARLGIEAGVDVLEVGAPLLLSEGVKTIGHLKRSFPDYPVVVNLQAMDGGARAVQLAAGHGAQGVTVCGAAADETIRAAVAAGREAGIKVVVDLVGCRDVVARAFECQDLGADLVLLRHGADQRRAAADGSPDATQCLEAVRRAVAVPVGVATYGVEDAVAAARGGAAVVAVGHPVISAEQPLAALSEYVRKVRAAAVGGRGGDS
jgi:3-keto-L-gulonate-6-phosphate decarboxylase